MGDLGHKGEDPNPNPNPNPSPNPNPNPNWQAVDAMPAGPVKDAAMAKLERKRAKASSSTTVDVEYETMEYIDEKGRKIKKKVKKTTTSTNAEAVQQQLEQDGTGTPNTVKAEGPVAQATLTVVCARLGLLWAGFGWSIGTVD